MRTSIIICFITLIFLSQAKAQLNEIIASDIKTLQVNVNGEWGLAPFIELNSDDYVEISFDNLSPEYNRYIYKITHCNADWSASDLSELDYLDGFNNNPIDDYKNSFNTMMLYTHYKLRIPNDDVRLTSSGNYIVSIFNDNDNNSNNPVAKACFSIIEKDVNVSATVSSNTDIDTNRSNQQVSFTINHSGYNIQNPATEIKVQILQNYRWDNMVTNIQPTYISNGQLQYTHNQNLIFKAGNEYRKFDMPDVHYVYEGVEKLSFFDPYYHAELFTNEPRKNYSFDVDQAGRFYIRNNEASDNDTEADYIFVHFTLKMDKPFSNGNIHLQGAFTNGKYDSSNKLNYNQQSGLYESVQVLKQGAYNYMYLFVPNGSNRGETSLVEGDFYETENEYMILVYHRPFGGRYDKLIGMQTIKFEQ